MSFTMSITLGNAAMSEDSDIIGAIERVADRIAGGQHDGPVTDRNRNTVGRYALTLPRARGLPEPEAA